MSSERDILLYHRQGIMTSWLRISHLSHDQSSQCLIAFSNEGMGITNVRICTVNKVMFFRHLASHGKTQSICTWHSYDLLYYTTEIIASECQERQEELPPTVAYCYILLCYHIFSTLSSMLEGKKCDLLSTSQLIPATQCYQHKRHATEFNNE